MIFKRCLFLIIFVIFFSAKVWALEPFYPQLQGYVTDAAKLISPEDRQTIELISSNLDKKTSIQIAVVTVPSTKPETIEGYAVRFFERLGVGLKGKDNGVLFLVASEDRAMRIEAGYGLEGRLTDALSHRIIDEIVIPQFKEGKFSLGILLGVQAISQVVGGEEIKGLVQPPVTGVDMDTWFSLFVLFIVVLIFIIGFVSRKSGYGGRYYGGGGGFGGGGGSFGGSSGGGFGGFGGGRSGGGGASGRW